jgi:hypothetical protein
MSLTIPADRQEIRISLEGTEQPIPYSGEERKDGTKNHGYFSILKDPTIIDKIPELFGEPIMKEFVRQINAPDGIFESVRINHFFCQCEKRIQRVFSIGFVFRDRRLFNEYRNCISFAGNLLEKKNKDSRIHGVEILLEIQPAIFRQEQTRGWIMDLYFSGVGDSEQKASDNLDTIFPLLMPLLTNGQCNH